MDNNNDPKNQSVPPEKNEKSDTKENTTKNQELKKVDTNPNSQEMEVHVKHKEHKEFNYKVFLYEFFIIFFAVSVSFFVENIRENYIEHHKEMQYVKSLVDDVKLDTAQLTRLIKYNKNQVEGIDSLLKVMKKPNNKNKESEIYVYSFHYLFSANFFAHTDRTISQLKNAGGLRLIESKASSDSIIAYDGSTHDIELNGEYCMKLFYDISVIQKQLLDYSIVNTSNFSVSITDGNLKLLTNDQKTIDLYFNNAVYYSIVLNSYKNKLIDLKKQAVYLLEILHKEYELD